MRSRAAPVAILGREFFARPTVGVAHDLVGSLLVVDAGTPAAVRARIVEVEAYLGQNDPASHAYRGPTPRARIMFGEAGHLYVYFSYGAHHCANVVTEPDGTAGAVLLRAAALEEGEDVVRGRRGAGAGRDALLRGPGNLCRGLGLTLLDNGMDLCAGNARLHIAQDGMRPEISLTTRVGISAAADRQLRFFWDGHPAVSRPVPRAGAQKRGTGWTGPSKSSAVVRQAR